MLHGGERLVLHLRFDLAAFLIELIEPRSERSGGWHIVSQQTPDADGHVIQAPCRVRAAARHRMQDQLR